MKIQKKVDIQVFHIVSLQNTKIFLIEQHVKIQVPKLIFTLIQP